LSISAVARSRRPTLPLAVWRVPLNMCCLNILSAASVVVPTQRGDAPKRVVVLAFDNIEQVRAWYDSPQYEALKALRDKSGKARIFAVEGVAP
jgi:Domain of unknown function (DUF1330)